ncbi:hypothetical protein GJ496_005218 [Pomphorhynchus laevis]|nr:hypothetical protein GJ496_005218 [Pomphorhynchus laevis]
MLYSKWIKDICKAILQQYPNPNQQAYSYGTAGFRTLSENMPFICSRIAIVAIFRAIYKNAAIGIMITASHNPWTDNGVKLIDPDGCMLEESWEILADKIVNCSECNIEEILDQFIGLLPRNPDHIFPATDESEFANIHMSTTVLLGYDTRLNNEQFALLIAEICSRLKVRSVNFSFLTTPQLHFMTNLVNTRFTDQLSIVDKNLEERYFQHFGSMYIKVMREIKGNSDIINISAIVDAANGIGGPKLEKMLSYLSSTGFVNTKNVQIINNDSSRLIASICEMGSLSSVCVRDYETLNKNCGSDFVKANQSLPEQMSSLQCSDLDHCISFDGDADRILYYMVDDENMGISNDNKRQIRLLDGDRICVLMAKYLIDRLSRLSKTREYLPSIGAVQTAYSNGNCTQYLRDILNLPVIITDTGVKNLHLEAYTNFDIGVYFEANGHGTVLFNKKVKSRLKSLSESASNLKDREIYNALFNLSRLINQTVGDALTLLLDIECVLSYFKMSCRDWYNLYDNLYNKLLKWTPSSVPDNVEKNKVKQKLVIKGPECICIQPSDLANGIKNLLDKYSNNKVRAFVRPSGTERAIRIYVEANDSKVVDYVANEIYGLLTAYILF